MPITSSHPFPLRRRVTELAGVAALLVTAVTPSPAAFEEIEGRVKEFTLENGLRFLVVERRDAPVFSYCTVVNAGGVDEAPGTTGVAHMFEHMAFKGTHTVGTTDYDAETKWLEKIDGIFQQILAERRKGPDADSVRIAELQAQMSEANEKAGQYVVTNEFMRLVEENGGVGLNAATMVDLTMYHYSLPSNRLELWAMLEGDRLTRPVLREFDTERQVVMQERRDRVESSPFGRLMTAFLGIAFPAHPYGNGVIGHRSDLESFTRADAWEFWRRYYAASNITIAVVGDVDAGEVRRLAEQYFSDVHTGPEPPRVTTVEPEQPGERRIIIEDRAQPVVIMGYPIPETRDPDYPGYEIMGLVLGEGRSSRLYTKLVKERGLAAQVGAGAGFPGEKYANLLSIFGLVAAGKDPQELEKAIIDVVENDLRQNPITQEELDGARTRVKADLVRGMRSNQGLAQSLAVFDRVQGDWRRLFRIDEILDAITTDDLARIGERTFRRSNRNVGMIVSPASNGGTSD